MGANFNLKTLTVALAALSAASIASAAGLDRSGQDITAFLQDGTYAETVYSKHPTIPSFPHLKNAR